jgi:phosphoribosyl-ATP pyrophosphohydrolase/phosphoribosyl-AMP cyclohydrolase
MTLQSPEALDWSKSDAGLLPAIVQHATTGEVLMLGYMNREALTQTVSGGRVVFHSRSRGELWLKGETSGHYLDVVDISADCDNDALLILAQPQGPTCHQGTSSCFATQRGAAAQPLAFLTQLQALIGRRITENPQDNTAGSYTARLFSAGPARIAQKIGEEGVEVALAAVGTDEARIVSETADLMYHLLLLLKSRNLSLERVTAELQARHTSRT